MNNLLKFSVSRTPSNLARLVHSSRSSAASVTSTRPAKKFSIDSSDQLPMYASILQHNLNHMIKMSRQYEKNLNGISKLINKLKIRLDIFKNTYILRSYSKVDPKGARKRPAENFQHRT